MCLADVHQQLMDQPLHQEPRCVDARYELRDYLKPVVYLNALDAFPHNVIHSWPLAIVEPERQQSK